MTREERLDCLCRLRSDISYMDFSIDIEVSLERKRQYRQALSEVIKALEQEPTTKNDLGVDCISRKYIYNRLHGLDHDEDYECDEYGGNKVIFHTCDYDEMLREVENAPSVFPKADSSVTPQEPVLDKIRAEIDVARFIDKDTKLCKNVNASGLEVAMKIIDKYKAESEDNK